MVIFHSKLLYGYYNPSIQPPIQDCEVLLVCQVPLHHFLCWEKWAQPVLRFGNGKATLCTSFAICSKTAGIPAVLHIFNHTL